jgi:Ner family transcriptional regulator
VVDWHPEDLKAEIRKRGETLASLGRYHGISRQVMANALAIPYAAAEQIIATFLGVPAHKIWPSRYKRDGRRKQPQPSANYQRQPRLTKPGANRA